MTDLYAVDFTRYDDSMFVEDVNAMVHAQLAEGPTLEYKQDLSDKEGWLQDVVAFANTFGGILIVGVTAPDGVPFSAPGFPEPSEAAVKMSNQLISCIQPRPEWEVKATRLPGDQARWVAIVRVKEGWDTPYMYSRAEKHRLYIRAGARKAEPDYLQLLRLIEKRRTADERANRSGAEIQRVRTQLNARSAGNLVSKDFYRFIAAAQSGSGGSIDLAKETAFEHAVTNAFLIDSQRWQDRAATGPGKQLHWNRNILDTSLSCFFHQEEVPPQFERRWTMSDSALGFASVASHDLQTEHRQFSFIDFIFDLVLFLLLARHHFEDAHHYGDLEVLVEIMLPEDTSLRPESVLGYPAYTALPSPSACLNVGRQVHGQALGSSRISVQPFTRERVLEVLSHLLNQIARCYGGVLRSDLAFVRPLLHDLGLK